MINRREVLAILAAASVSRGALAAAPTLRLALTGDCLFTQELVRDDPALKAILPVLRGADVTIGNFEGTLADRDAWAAAVLPNGTPICGGLNIRGPDSVARDLAWMGYDMFGLANNHSWDWGPEGIAATVRKLTAANLHPAGAGDDLDAARRPSRLVAGGARVALISCSSTFWPGTNATHANANVRGRPGLSPLGIKPFGAGLNGVKTVEPRDLEELTQSIRDARATSDIVVISCHSHENGRDRTQPSGFLIDFAHACVDAGATLFFSHGPHVVRGVEIYRSAPILYGLGCFIMRNHGHDSLPEELFENCDLKNRDAEAYLGSISRGWENDPLFWEGAIFELEYKGGQLRSLSLRPTVIQNQEKENWGMPSLASGERGLQIMERIKGYSAAFGTTMEISPAQAYFKL